MKSRRGIGKAIVALARKFLGIIYRTLKNKWVFADFPNFVLAEEALQHDQRRLHLRFAQHGFAPAPAACHERSKPEARNLGVDTASKEEFI
jgi:hypothetical protein